MLPEYQEFCANYNFCRLCGCPMSDEEFYAPEELREKEKKEEDLRIKRKRKCRLDDR
jgi:hypothetical protein